MGGLFDCKEEFIQARKPFTEFLSLNREGKEEYTQFKDILTQLSPGASDLRVIAVVSDLHRLQT